jgi:hypothetical protein
MLWGYIFGLHTAFSLNLDFREQNVALHIKDKHFQEWCAMTATESDL